MCRSCTYLDIGLETALQKKYQRFVELGAAQLSHCEIIKPFTVISAFGSRAKAKLLVSGTAQDPIIGLQDKNFHGIELESCPLHLPVLNRITKTIHTKIPEYDLEPYDVKARRGELKGIIISTNQNETEVLVRFVLRSRDVEDKIRALSPVLQSLYPEIQGVSINIQPIPHAILEGEAVHA